MHNDASTQRNRQNFPRLSHLSKRTPESTNTVLIVIIVIVNVINSNCNKITQTTGQILPQTTHQFTQRHSHNNVCK